jgi:hypothetical protein
VPPPARAFIAPASRPDPKMTSGGFMPGILAPYPA